MNLLVLIRKKNELIAYGKHKLNPDKVFSNKTIRIIIEQFNLTI